MSEELKEQIKQRMVVLDHRISKLKERINKDAKTLEEMQAEWHFLDSELV